MNQYLEIAKQVKEDRRLPSKAERSNNIDLRPGTQVRTDWTGTPNIKGTIKEITPGPPGWPPIALVETSRGQAQVMLTALRPVEEGGSGAGKAN